MRRICVVVALAIGISIVSPDLAGAAGSQSVVVSEMMTGTSANASQEFVELYNLSPSSVSVSGWTIEYKSATSVDVPSSWSKKATLSGSMSPYGFYLVAPKAFYPDADADWSAGLASGGGSIRLKNTNGSVIDLLGYGTANTYEGNAAIAPPAGQSIERLPGKTDETAGNGIDTDFNGLDFVIRLTPAPQNQSSPPELPTDGLLPPTQPDNDGTASVSVLITELLPNPMTPQTDANDEFIELYNPNDQPVNLGGYKLRTGSDFHSSYTLPGMTLMSGAYMVLKSSQTKLSLVNSGGAVQLLDPVGSLVDQTGAYGTAAEGQAWALFEDGWHWTLQPTPGSPNIEVTPLVLASATKATAPKSTKAKAATKKATAKSVTKSAKAKALKKKKAPKTKKLKLKPQLAAAKIQSSTWLIIALAVFTIGYALYEFRHDFKNYYFRVRGHIGGRSGHSEPPKGRGDS